MLAATPFARRLTGGKSNGTIPVGRRSEVRRILRPALSTITLAVSFPADE
ncbi:MAG: hypothetical protein IJY71_04825 [Clostridia bacterium]|nr:hypothetical protein [Clostridia bacterium]MBQ9129999.1 hypothetical protein [Clostridia bacterium]